MRIPVNEFKPITQLVLGASTDETRFHLCGVHFDPSTGKGQATNGHALSQNQIAIDPDWSDDKVTDAALCASPAKPVIIAAETCIAINKTKTKHNFGAWIELLPNCIRLSVLGGSTQEWKYITDAQFPDISQVMPKADAKPESTICFNPILLAQLAKSMGFDPGQKQVVRLEIFDKASPIRVSVNGQTGLLMPMRGDK